MEETCLLKQGGKETRLLKLGESRSLYIKYKLSNRGEHHCALHLLLRGPLHLPRTKLALPLTRNTLSLTRTALPLPRSNIAEA